MKMAWISSESFWVEVIKTMPEYSLIKYSENGWDFEEWIENDDLIYPHEMGIDYESDTETF